jgi:DUF2075 family protein
MRSRGLAADGDRRSSYQLEVPASEFECQGLELDCVGVCWGNDLSWDPHRASWRYRRFRGARWQDIRQAQARVYLVNAYRVLLTRARDGIVIWVPPGDPKDETLPPSDFDATAQYLQSCGIRSLE